MLDVSYTFEFSTRDRGMRIALEVSGNEFRQAALTSHIRHQLRSHFHKAGIHCYDERACKNCNAQPAYQQAADGATGDWCGLCVRRALELLPVLDQMVSEDGAFDAMVCGNMAAVMGWTFRALDSANGKPTFIPYSTVGQRSVTLEQWGDVEEVSEDAEEYAMPLTTPPPPRTYSAFVTNPDMQKLLADRLLQQTNLKLVNVGAIAKPKKKKAARGFKAALHKYKNYKARR